MILKEFLRFFQEFDFIACFKLFYILFGGKAAETRGSFAAQFVSVGGNRSNWLNMTWCQWCRRVDGHFTSTRIVANVHHFWALAPPGTGINTRGQSSALGSPSAGTSVLWFALGWFEDEFRQNFYAEFIWVHCTSVWISWASSSSHSLCFSGSRRQRCGEQSVAPQSPFVAPWRTEGDKGFVWKPQNPIESYGWS